MCIKLYCRILMCCCLWMNCNWQFCSPQQPSCNYAGFTSLTRECHVSAVTTDRNNTTKILNFSKCVQVPLLQDTMQTLNSCQALSIRCNFNGDDHLQIQKGLFSRMKDDLGQMDLNFNNVETIPDGTFCELTNLTAVELTHNSLHDITFMGFGMGCKDQLSTMNLETLRIHHNSIQVLKNGTFAKLSNLVYLDASYNTLNKIEAGALDGLVTLEVLDLSHNELVWISAGVFDKVPLLYNLNLANNKLVTSGLYSLRYPSQLQILNLCSNRLSSIEELDLGALGDLTELDLSGNTFDVLNASLGSLNLLSTLSISNASLRHIHPMAFRGLTSLTNLDLNYNRLSTIEPETFHHCPKLQYLEISHNWLHSLPDVSHLKNLKAIDLSGNGIGQIQEMTKWNSNALTNIDLSQNAIRTVERGPLLHLKSLTRLNLSHNEIAWIQPGAFDGIPDRNSTCLVTLDFNQLTTIEGAFTHSNVTCLSVEHNELRGFTYSSIPAGLQDLHLGHNKITRVDVDVSSASFENFEVKTIDLSHNSLEGISGHIFPESTEVLLLHYNSIGWLDEQFLKPLSGLRNLTLHHNKLELLCPQVVNNGLLSPPLTTTLSENPFVCSCEMSWMKDARLDASRGSYGYIKDMPKVTCRNAFPKYGDYEVYVVRTWRYQKYLCRSTYEDPDFCRCATSKTLPCDLPCPKNCTCYRDRDSVFAIADCSLVNLTTVPTAVPFGGASEVHLYLDGNALPDIAAADFAWYFNVTKLFLNGSHVRRVQADAFQRLTSLTVLDLDDNCLQSLPDGIFAKLTWLQELYLAHNHLEDLGIELLLPMASLQVLDLHDNRLSNFAVPRLEQLPRLSNVSLHQNPWSCECQFVGRFREWLQRYLKIVSDAENLSCTPDGTGEYVPLISSSFASCNQATVLQQTARTAAIWGSLLGAVLLLIAICVLTFVYRREMEVIIYSRFGVRVFSGGGRDSDSYKPYDAFISYSSLDEEFLVYQFLPGLERIENPYRLCLHHRDFTVGAFITENILAAVEKSRRTILLLSDNFILSEWCRFEFKAAHIQMLKDRCNRVIIIVLDKIPKNLDPEMKLYLDTNTYLKWGDKLFWKKLYFAMPDKRQRAISIS